MTSIYPLHQYAESLNTPTHASTDPANAQQDIELVKAAIEAHARGGIHLPSSKGNKGNHLVVASDYVDRELTHNQNGFTRQSLHDYLALAQWRVDQALNPAPLPGCGGRTSRMLATQAGQDFRLLGIHSCCVAFINILPAAGVCQSGLILM